MPNGGSTCNELLLFDLYSMMLIILDVYETKGYGYPSGGATKPAKAGIFSNIYLIV